MPSLNKDALGFAVEFHKTFANLQGYQDPAKVVDTAKIFMAYLMSEPDNSAKAESAPQKTATRNLSKSDNS